MSEQKMIRLEKKIGYHFQDSQLLFQALSHSSFANEHRAEGYQDNERLEFLGDAVLEVVSSDFLYHNYPDLQEGKLTKLRASLVCEPTLALCAKEFDLSSFLLLGKGEEHTGGRLRNSIVSDALEALIGAIYLDGGLGPARTFIERFVLTDIEHKKLFYDSKTVLQELVQKDCPHDNIRYVIIGEDGPDHAKTFRVEVEIGGSVAGTGSGSTKKAAEQEAAYQALHALLSDREKE
ncbi:MAG: ribonuclease III [Lachnospiraceae bacterium]|nr:ribonuclease III [Lachnospiraceae bacterium]